MKKKEICFETEIFPEFDIKIGNGACMQDGTIYVSNQGKKDICIFDTTTFSKQFITVETREKGYNTVNVFCKYLYLTGKRKVLYKYNMEDGSIAEVDLDNSSFWICDEEGNIVKDAKSHIFKESYLINNEYLILIPWYLWDTTANSIVVFSISNNCINYFNVLNGMINSNVRGIRYICKPSFDENHKIVIYIDEYGTFSIDLSNNSVVKKKYIVKKVNVINKYLLDKGLIKEDELMSLKDFIDHVTREG